MKLKKAVSAFCIILSFILILSGCTIKRNGSEESEGTKAYDWPLSDLNKHYGNTFGQGQIIDVNVEIAEEELEDLKTNATKEEFHPSDITVNSTTVKNVGFRTKGFSSLTTA
jgi:spore coat protein CotH